MNHEFHAIDGQGDIDRLEKVRGLIIDEPWRLRIDWILAQGWVAVPVEKGRHFEEDEARRTAKAMREFGYAHCVAVAAEPLAVGPYGYYIPATEEGLCSFSAACAGLNFLLMPEDQGYAILCTTEDYNLYAGPVEFVERCLGTDLATARKTFREIASDDWWKGRLLEVADRYERMQAE